MFLSALATCGYLPDIIYEAPVSSSSGAMPFQLTGDLQSTQSEAEASPTLEETTKYGVLKDAWPESTRLSEVKILEEAVEIGEKDEKVRGHLPVLFCSRALKYMTTGIKSMSGICDENEVEREERGKKGQPRRGSRTCRLLVFEELHEIETLESDNLLEAFAAIVDCKHPLLFSLLRFSCLNPKVITLFGQLVESSTTTSVLET